MNKELIKEYANNEYPIIGDYDKSRYGNDHMNEYVLKNTVEAIKLTNGMICGFEKPSIETRFCFHDEGPDYEYYKELISDKECMKHYFMDMNLKNYDELLEAFEDREDKDKVPCIYDYENGNCRPSYKHWCCDDKNWKDVSEKDRDLIYNTLLKLRANFEKRLEIWWKKYGFEKLHTWTYWADA